MRWTVLLTGIMSVCFGSCSSEPTASRYPFAKGDELVMLGPGTSVPVVRELVKSPGLNLFTVQRENSVFSLIEFRVGDDDGTGVTVWSLFRNGLLEKFVDWQKPALEEYLYQGTTASRLKSWSVYDETRIDACIGASALTKKEIAGRVALSKAREEPQLSTDLMQMIGSKKRRKKLLVEYRKNAQYLKVYDGQKITLGMSVIEVERRYGKPLLRRAVDEKRSIALYASGIRLEVHPELEYSPVCVEFEADRVLKVLGKSFFSPDWFTE
jgi:hypothetical protein